MKTKIFLIRHAECIGNVEMKLAGRTDFELTDKGVIQAEKIANCMKEKDLDIIYSSPLKRAKVTAEYIANYSNIKNINISSNLIEIDYGVCDGVSWQEIDEKYPYIRKNWKEIYNYPIGIPNQESFEELQSRMAKEIKHIIEMHKGKTICIVSHGIAISSFLSYLYNMKFTEINKLKKQDNTAYTEIDYEDNKFTIICEANSEHLN